MHLLTAGADPSVRDLSGCTALYYASRSGRQELVEELVQRGVTLAMDPTHLTFKLCMAAAQVRGGGLAAASAYAGAALALPLLTNPTMIFWDRWRQTPDVRRMPHVLCCGAAAQNEDVSFLRCMVKAGANLTAPLMGFGATPLHYAAAADNVAAVQLLLHEVPTAAEDRWVWVHGPGPDRHSP